MPVDTNPLQILTFIVAPAILTNASTVMTMGTSNRLARAVDRVRVLGAAIQAGTGEREELELRERQLASAERRVLLLVRAMMAFYLSVGSFAAASLASLIGAVFFVGRRRRLARHRADRGLYRRDCGGAGINRRLSAADRRIADELVHLAR